jgi:hypothetical protein
MLRTSTTDRVPALPLALAASVLVGPGAFGQEILVNRDEEFEPKTVVLPYVFYNENLAFGAGPAFVASGSLQDQMSLLAGGFLTTNMSRSLFFFGTNTQIPLGDRLFLDSRISLSKIEDFESYINGNPRYPFERAGSHNSDEDNFIEGEGEDDFVRLNFKYLLPIGHGRDDVITKYVLDRGLVHEGPTGGDAFNPFKSGRSYVELETFYRNQDMNSTFVDSELRTNGLRLSMRYDNRDFAVNPSRGNVLRTSVTRDFGALDSTDCWTNVDGEFSQFFPLGSSKYFRQVVLALNVWTSYSPTWEDDDGQPPLFAGASLGGLDRLKGYPEGRFYDKAAIYYTAELRLIPEWNPIGPESRLDWLEVDWIMFAPFLEIGRVAESWSVRSLHSDMNWSAGVGFRAMAKHVVLRFDTAFSPEGARVQMMIHHPF